MLLVTLVVADRLKAGHKFRQGLLYSPTKYLPLLVDKAFPFPPNPHRMAKLVGHGFQLQLNDWLGFLDDQHFVALAQKPLDEPLRQWINHAELKDPKTIRPLGADYVP